MRMTFAIAALTMLWFFCGTSMALPANAGRDGRKPPRIVEGLGDTIESAKTDAINKAIHEVKDFCSLTSFLPSRDYLQRNLLVDEGIGKDLKLPEFEKPFKSWVLTFRDDANWSDLVRRNDEAERQVRARERQKMGSLVIVGLAFLLLVGFGYVKLDEYTQRRYTTWLRLAGVGAGSVVIATWWLVVTHGAG